MSTQNDRYAFAKSPRPRRAVGGKPTRRLRPSLDVLEERTVMSTIMVNSLADTANPPAGTVTLRSAIQQANSQPGGNEIDLSVSGSYQNITGAYIITSGGGSLTIRNTSGGGVAINGTASDRVFDINPALDATPFNVSIQGVFVQNGNAPSTDPVTGSGGGVRTQGAVSLSLTGVTFLDNHATANGGGLAVLNGVSGSQLVMNTQFLNNAADLDGGGASLGGGNTFSTFSNVLFQGNQARSGGGIEDPGAAQLILQNTTFNGNRAVGGNGGGLDVTNPTGTGNLIAIQSNFSFFENNKASGSVNPPAAGTGNGGAINQSAGVLTVTSSQFAGNQAAGGGGAVLAGAPSITVNASSFFYNQAGASVGANNPNATPGDGGALDFLGTGTSAANTGSLVVNSTFSLNAATGRGGAISDGGAGDLTLVYNTINANNAGQDGGGVARLAGASAGTLRVQNTILYNNTNTGSTSPDVSTAAGAPVSDQGGNLVGTSGTGNTGFLAGTLTANPLLGPATDNGGSSGSAGINPPLDIAGNQQPLLTEALDPASPAISAGVASQNTNIDQRQFPRPGAGNPKSTIGAYEPQFTTPASVPFVIGTDGNVYFQQFNEVNQRPVGPPFGSYLPTGLTSAAAVSATRYGVGSLRFEAFAVGAGGQVSAVTVDPNAKPGAVVAAAPGAILSISTGTDAHGDPLLFAIDTDNQLRGQRFDAVTGQPTSSTYYRPAFGDFKLTFVTHDKSGTNPVLYVVGTDGQVYYLLLDGNGFPIGSNNGTNTVPLKKLSYGPVNQLVVTHLANNTPEIFVVGTDNYIYSHSLDANGGTTNIGNYVGGTIGPVVSLSVTNLPGSPSGNPELFAVGTDNKVYRQSVDANGNLVPNTLTQTGTAPGGTLSIFAGSGNDPKGASPLNFPLVFALSATDSQLYFQQFDANGVNPGPFTLLGTGAVKKQTLVNQSVVALA